MYVESYDLYRKIIRKPYKIYHFMDKKTQCHKDVKSSSKPSVVIAVIKHVPCAWHCSNLFNSKKCTQFVNTVINNWWENQSG